MKCPNCDGEKGEWLAGASAHHTNWIKCSTCKGTGTIKPKLPELVEECPFCKGKGEYKQTYNAGCGMGSHQSMGPCSFCAHPSLFMIGLGYRMKDGSEVPLSVINQINVMNKVRWQ